MAPVVPEQLCTKVVQLFKLTQIPTAGGLVTAQLLELRRQRLPHRLWGQVGRGPGPEHDKQPALQRVLLFNSGSG
ncbi:hypothetical protein D9M73_45800 [compost metagenome]